MPFLSCFPENHHLSDVFKNFPIAVRPLLELHDELLRGPAALTVGERELVAAVTSGTNACSFCFGSHALAAERFGIPEDLIRAVLEDVDSADVEEKLKPLLKYVIKLTRDPAKIIKEDADAVLSVGWSEEALHCAVYVCGLFNLMNRIVEGMGVKANMDLMTERGNQIRETSIEQRAKIGNQYQGDPDYMNFGRMSGVVKD